MCIRPTLYNRLAAESSPYLIQHARNPVAWQPWCEKAFEAARRCCVPVFLSIGYSTCHWCHVMSRESFENEEIAGRLNENFVCIKVDREERPDIDAVYMRYCQALTGSGGWPLTIIMTPDKEPFFAATYLPPRSRGGRIGILDLTARIAQAWQTRRDAVIGSARDITAEISRMQSSSAAAAPHADLPAQAFNGLRASFDRVNGGFGHAPKFPTPHTLLFLLRFWKRTGEHDALDMATSTLRAMRRGGIYDHIGFGFHRYSTDPSWFLPHFEKMLYDQALLLWAYTEAYQVTGAEEFAATACEIAAFVLRDLRSPEGGFYCALDADDEGGEGAYYRWTHAELTGLLDPAELRMAEELCGMTREGNARDEASGRTTGANIIHQLDSLADYALRSGLSSREAARRLESLRRKLFEARLHRIPPARDRKILTDWNALMFGALAMAGRVLENTDFATEAKRAADCILRLLYRPESGLLHSYCNGAPSVTAHIDDYSFMIWGLMELYQTVFDAHYLLRAIALQDEQRSRYADERSGAFFITHADANDLPFRPLEILDGALPSGNSMAALNLQRLAAVTGRTDYAEHARRICEAFNARLNRMPEACCMLMCAFEYATGPRTTVTIAGIPEAPDTQELLRCINSLYLPDVCVLLHSRGGCSGALAAHMPGAELKKPVNGRPAAYVCSGTACRAPVCDGEELKLLLMS